MEPVGFVGIIKLTTSIILRNWKHFLCIALVLAVPSALDLLLLDSSGSIKLLLAFVSVLYKRLLPNGGRLPPFVIDNSAMDKPGSHRHPRLALDITLLAFSLAVYLICTPLLTFSACRACLGRKVDLKGSAKGIGGSVGKLVVTALGVAAAFVGGGVVATVVVVVTVAVGATVGGGTAGAVISVAGAAVAGAGLAFLAVGLNLAGTVAILEEARGWEAMARSMYLVRQRRGVTLGLLLLFRVCDLLLLPVLTSGSRWISLGVGHEVKTLIVLLSMVARVVLYMSCRASLHEPLDSILAAAAPFGPLDSSQAKYLDLETASFATQST